MNLHRTLSLDLCPNPLEILKDTGVLIIPQERAPLTLEDWEYMDLLSNSLDFEKLQVGDTNEAISLKVFRIKKPGLDAIYHKKIMGIVTSAALIDFFKQLLQTSTVHIDRCQYHLYNPGDFVSMHTDTESNALYKFSVIFVLSDSYQGGEFCIKSYENNTISCYQPPKYSLLVTRGDLLHEVKPVKAGVRKTIVSFLIVDPN